MSIKGRALRLLSGLLTEGEITSVTDLSAAFLLVRLRSKVGANWRPGDKVQVLFPSNEVRTFTPIGWSAEGTTALLVYLHGDTPAVRWARHLDAGQRIHFAGPQRSLSMPEGPLTLIGDETSLAIAASYRSTRTQPVRCIFEIGASVVIDAALAELGLGDALVVRREAGAPAGRSLAAALPALAGPVGITGGAELVKQARATLRAQGARDIKTKTYWIAGRVGLD